MGNTDFDSKLLVETNNNIDIHKLFSSSGIQYDLIEFLNREKVISVGFNEINPDFTEKLKGKKYLAVYEKDEWMLDKDIIKSSFKIAQKLLLKFNKTL